MSKSELWLPSGVRPTAEESFPPSVASDARRKAFYPLVVEQPESIEILGEGIVEEALGLPDTEKVSMRIITPFSALAGYLEEHHNTGQLVEAAYPLCPEGVNPQDHLWIAYLGSATDSRRALAMAPETGVIDGIWRAQQNTISRDLFETEELEVLDEPTDQDRQQLHELYEPTFGMDLETVDEMLEDPRMQLIVLRAGGIIASVAAYYRTQVQVGSIGDLRFAEVTEAATHPDHRGKGYYGMCAAAVVVMAEKDGADVIFGECNGSDVGVHAAAKRSGRRSARQAAHNAGLLGIEGILRSVVPISGEIRNLFPTFKVTRAIR
ncbi:MAG: GNAT family N-acetyltransferase [Candidatus Saccharimonadales bacterium]